MGLEATSLPIPQVPQEASKGVDASNWIIREMEGLNFIDRFNDI